MTLKDQVAHRFADAGGRLRVRSALNPALWLCAFVTAPAIIAATQITGPTPLWLILIAAAPVVLACIGFLFLLVVDRDKLQSEDYQIRKRSLEVILQKGQSFAISPTSIEAIANPERRALTHEDGGDA